MTTLTNPGKTEQENQKFTLSDGRILGFSEYGDLNGSPLMYFHGTGNCRYEAGLYHEFGLKHNAHIIGVDRPSMGLSTKHENRTLLDWPKDVNELADHLNIAKYSVVGISGGAPHALVCAHSSPDRVTACTLVVPIGPRTPVSNGWTKKQGWMYDVYTRLPWMYGILVKSTEKLMQGEKIDEKRLAKLPICEADKKIYRNHFKVIALLNQEGYRNGYKGGIQDLQIFAQKGTHPWGFSLEGLSPAIRYSIWIGGNDDLYLHGKEMAEQIPGCELYDFPDLGHLSTPFENREEIIKITIGV